MEKKNNCVKVGFSTILWAVLAILLCAAPSIWADETVPANESHEIKDYEVTGNLIVYGTVTLRSGALVQLSLKAHPDSVVNIWPGALITKHLNAYPSSVVNIYGGNVGEYIFVTTDTPSPVVTVYGTDFAVDGEPLDPIPDQVTFTDGSGTLTVTYDDDTTADLLFYSDIPINLVDTAGGESFEEAVKDIIADIMGMDPEDAEKEMEKAVTELNKAIDEFSNDRIDKAFNKIAKAVKHLMKAQKKGADTKDVQDVIDDLVDLVQGIAKEAIEDAIEVAGEDNPHVIKAQEHYDKAFEKLADGKYNAAIKKFKNAYREAMKALGE